MNTPPGLLETLPVVHRLAVSYAPSAARRATLALLALDARLAGIVRSASEPMLAQIRLAWWRDHLGKGADAFPRGEPLLAALESWGGVLPALGGLVDGWEAMTGEAPLDTAAFAGLAEARGAAFAGLAEVIGVAHVAGAAREQGEGWALADIAACLRDPVERDAAQALLERRDWHLEPLPRLLRPLTVLYGLAARAVRRGEPCGGGGPGALVAAVRLGLAGR